MNTVSLVGRLTADPEVRYSGDTAIARYRIAVDRVYKRDGDPTADFIPVTAFGKAGEFIEKYFRRGMKIGVTGRIQTGTYKNKDGGTVYTWDVIAERQEFVESKAAQGESGQQYSVTAPQTAPPATSDADGFMEADEMDLPWNA